MLQESEQIRSLEARLDSFEARLNSLTGGQLGQLGGSDRAQLLVDDNGTLRFNLCDAKGRAVLSLVVDPDGYPRLIMRDNDMKARLMIRTHGEGTAEIAMGDDLPARHPVIHLSLSETGEAKLGFIDADTEETRVGMGFVPKGKADFTLRMDEKEGGPKLDLLVDSNGTSLTMSPTEGKAPSLRLEVQPNGASSVLVGDILRDDKPSVLLSSNSTSDGAGATLEFGQGTTTRLQVKLSNALEPMIAMYDSRSRNTMVLGLVDGWCPGLTFYDRDGQTKRLSMFMAQEPEYTFPCLGINDRLGNMRALLSTSDKGLASLLVLDERARITHSLGV